MASSHESFRCGSHKFRELKTIPDNILPQIGLHIYISRRMMFWNTPENSLHSVLWHCVPISSIKCEIKIEIWVFAFFTWFQLLQLRKIPSHFNNALFAFSRLFFFSQVSVDCCLRFPWIERIQTKKICVGFRKSPVTLTSYTTNKLLWSQLRNFAREKVTAYTLAQKLDQGLRENLCIKLRRKTSKKHHFCAIKFQWIISRHQPYLVSSEISDLQNFWLHTMYACAE